MSPEELERWAGERAAAGDETALRDALEALLLPYLERHEHGYLWGLVGESFVRAQRRAGGGAAPDDLEVE